MGLLHHQCILAYVKLNNISQPNKQKIQNEKKWYEYAIDSYNNVFILDLEVRISTNCIKSF